MTDGEWKQLQEQLKTIGPGAQDGPEDKARFQEQVLDKYERRSRFDLRSRWVRRSLTLVTVCAALWLGLFITKPFAPTPSSQAAANGVASNRAMMSGAPQANHDDATTVHQFFDLYLQKRSQEAQKYLTGNARSEASLIPVNMSNPHMTGFTMQKVVSGGKENVYRVSLNWATYGESAYLDTYQVTVIQQSDGTWLIREIQKQGEVTYDGTARGVIRRTDSQGVTQIPLTKAEQAQDGTFFAVDPYDDKQLVFAEQGARPVLYKVGVGAAPQKIATLPPGQVGEIFWMQDDLLAMNFQPQGTTDADVVLFYDVKTGEAKHFPNLERSLQEMQIHNAHVVHTLPGQQLRIRAGAQSLLVDLRNDSMSVALDPNSHDEMALLQQVVYDTRVQGLKSSQLQVQDADGTLTKQDLDALGIPASKRIDPSKATGMYVINGSVQAFTLFGNDLQIEVSQDPGCVEVLSVPWQSLQPLAGQSIRVRVFDETGYVLAPTKVVQVP